MQPAISSVVKRIRGRGVRSVGRVYSDKNVYYCLSFKAILRLRIISITNLDSVASFQEIIYLE